MPAHIHPPTPRALEGILQVPAESAGKGYTTISTNYYWEPIVQLKHIIASGCIGRDDSEIKGGSIGGSKDSGDKSSHGCNGVVEGCLVGTATR